MSDSGGYDVVIHFAPLTGSEIQLRVHFSEKENALSLFGLADTQGAVNSVEADAISALVNLGTDRTAERQVTTPVTQRKGTMTIEQKIKKSMINSGLFPEQAQMILENVKNNSASESLKDRWNDDASGYPTTLLSAVLTDARKEALKWIDANQPNHWARGMFA